MRFVYVMLDGVMYRFQKKAWQLCCLQIATGKLEAREAFEANGDNIADDSFDATGWSKDKYLDALTAAITGPAKEDEEEEEESEV